jgi:hypothetical protein
MTTKPLLEVVFPETGDSREAGLYDVCEWWIETYPEDIFINEPKPVVAARKAMQQILAMRKDK